MKYISRILFTLGLVLGLSACTEDAFETNVPGLPTKGDMSVNLTFALPDVEAQTRSMVSGEEQRVHTMQMVCFDANGGYLGIRNAEITPSITVDTGTIKGSVPQGTSRIHFIANRNLSIPLNEAVVGMPEATVMGLEELSTIWNENTIGTGDGAHQEICYWGYHKEAKDDAMNSWLNPTTGSNKFYMIRDRAQVVFRYTANATDELVESIEWLIHNGRERGYLAPAEASWDNTKYYAYSTSEGHTSEIISVAGMNEYTDCGRYSLLTDDFNAENPDVFDWAYPATTATPSQPQFLFDDRNDDGDGLKVIVRVKYKGNITKYHVLRLNKTSDDGDSKIFYPIVRNKTYYIDAKNFKPTIAAYPTLEDALNGTEYMNADMEVSRDITDISNKKYTLQILLPTQTTSTVFNTEGEHKMDFAFRLVNDISTSGTVDPNAFEVYWENSQGFCQEDLDVSYNTSTKQFTITATVPKTPEGGKSVLTDQLQDQWIVVKHIASGLTRYIHVYAIDQFRFIKDFEPKLTRVGTTNNYLLSFKIPPTEHTKFLENGDPDPSEPIYPTGLYPIDVKFTTNTLNAYNTSSTGTNYGLFGVGVESTENLLSAGNFETNYGGKYATPISTMADTDIRRWYYQHKLWDFWFTYSIKAYPTNGTGTDDDGMVNIYLQDVRSHIAYAGNQGVQDVGLFMYINYFGKIYSIPVTANTTP